MTLGSALYMVLIRVFRDTPVVLAGGAAGLPLFVVGWFVVDLLAVTQQDILLLLLIGISYAVAVVLWTEGTRLIPATEVGLLGSAETPFAIIFAWILLGGWFLATLGSVVSFAFIFAFKTTYVANVAVIYGTAPFVAAGLGWLLLGEIVRWQTLIAAIFSAFGVLIVVAGGLGSGSIVGDTVALVMTLGSALYMVLIRVFRDTPVVLAGGAAGLPLFVVGWFVVDLLAVTQQDILLLLLIGISYAVAVVLWTEGTRLIPATEVGLLGSAETPFAIIFAWILLAELPPLASFIGGGIALAAVFGHAVRDFTRTQTMP